MIYLVEQGNYDSTDLKKAFTDKGKAIKFFNNKFGAWNQDEPSGAYLKGVTVLMGAHKDHGTWAILYEMVIS
jgi:hypothetical protein